MDDTHDPAAPSPKATPAPQAPPDPPGPELATMIKRAREIKAKYVDPNLRWYNEHRRIPFFWFRATGILTILLSASLPAVSTFDWGTNNSTAKTLWIAGISVTIAVLATLSSFFKWERTWRGRTTTHYALEALCAKWELELENAHTLPTTHDQVQHVYLATSDLLTNFRNAGAAESDEFFSGMQFPQSDKAGQTTKPPAPPAPAPKPGPKAGDTPEKLAS